MRGGFSNQVLSSFLLWFDHWLLKTGQAYTASTTGLFYKVPNKYNGLYSYAFPYKPFVADSGITGVPSGVYLNSNFIVKGQSGLQEINWNEGLLYFNSQLANSNQLSGNFSVKDFDVRLTTEPEEKLLFETKYQIRSKTKQTLSGLHEDQVTYPVIFLKYFGGDNTEGAFGGQEWTEERVRAIVIADSEFKNIAVNSLFKDRVRSFVPLLTQSEMPYNALGGVNSGYNYTTLTSGKFHGDDSIFLEKVAVSNLNYSAYNNIKELNPNVFCSLIDFEMKTLRQPRA